MLFKHYALCSENFWRYRSGNYNTKHKWASKIPGWNLSLGDSTADSKPRGSGSSEINLGRPNSQYQGLPKTEGKPVQMCSAKPHFQTNFNLFLRGRLHLFFLKGNFLIRTKSFIIHCDTGFLPWGFLWLFTCAANWKGKSYSDDWAWL